MSDINFLNLFGLILGLLLGKMADLDIKRILDE